MVLVVGANKGKVTLIAGVSKDLSEQFQAGQLIREISPLVDGKGGGNNIHGIAQAIEATYQWVAHTISIK